MDITGILSNLQDLLSKAELPEMRNILNLFMMATDDQKSVIELADALAQADKGQEISPEIEEGIVSLYLYAVNMGDENAMNNLGAFYYGGRTGAPDYEKALVCYLNAANQGSYLAAENAAYCYYYGRGMEKNYEKAYQLFSKAALAGCGEAMYKIGDMYRYGLYVERDYGFALHCYRKAEEMMRDNSDEEPGKPGSVYLRLADMYYEGLGTPQDINQAYMYYQFAERGFYMQLQKEPYYEKDLNRVYDMQKKLRKKIKAQVLG